jgi:hypothetical protein
MWRKNKKNRVATLNKPDDLKNRTKKKY